MIEFLEVRQRGVCQEAGKLLERLDPHEIMSDVFGLALVDLLEQCRQVTYIFREFREMCVQFLSCHFQLHVSDVTIPIEPPNEFLQILR